MKIFRTDRERMRRLHEAHLNRHTEDLVATRPTDLKSLSWKPKRVEHIQPAAEDPALTTTSEVTKI